MSQLKIDGLRTAKLQEFEKVVKKVDQRIKNVELRLGGIDKVTNLIKEMQAKLDSSIVRQSSTSSANLSPDLRTPTSKIMPRHSSIKIPVRNYVSPLVISEEQNTQIMEESEDNMQNRQKQEQNIPIKNQENIDHIIKSLDELQNQPKLVSQNKNLTIIPIQHPTLSYTPLTATQITEPFLNIPLLEPDGR